MNVVAIDGPAGSGKSTVSRLVAQRLGWAHLDTGAFYRAASLRVLQEDMDAADESAVAALIESASFDQVDGMMILDGVDVSESIRTAPVNAIVSVVAAHKAVRKRLVAAQRSWVVRQGSRAVVEGRDIGTVVFPNALLKVFLTADPAERARRRAEETGADAATVSALLAVRDGLDRRREVSPLAVAEDAVLIDTTHLSLRDAVDEVVRLVENAVDQSNRPRAFEADH